MTATTTTPPACPASTRRPAAPSRLCTLLSKARASIAAGEGPVDASLVRVAGYDEWTLDVFCDEARLAATLRETAIQIPPAASAVVRRRLAAEEQERAARQIRRRMNQLPDEILDAIEPHVHEVVEKPVPGRPCDARGARVSRLAVLVARGREDAFRAALRSVSERLAREGASLELCVAPYPGSHVTLTAGVAA